MRTLQLLSLVLVISITSYSQHSLTGVWAGTLSNDSSTVRRDQSYELALTEYRGKVYGYSRSTFIVNDTLYYMVKRVKGSIDGDVCEVKDDDIISNNFHGKIDKGVKMITTFRMNKQDTTWYLDGNWKTNKTKNFYSISGKVSLKGESDLSKSKILPHLEELNVADDIAFYTESKKAASPQPELPKPIAPPATTVAKKETTTPKQKQATAKQEEKKPVTELAPSQQKPTATDALATSTTSKENSTTTPATTNKVTEEKKKPVPAVTTTASTTPVTKEPVTNLPKPEIKIPVAAAAVAERKTVAPQIVSFHADSLELALYDNGEVDGDTVSVLMNGELIIAKQGLKTVAIKKTIYIKPGEEEFTLVLYAENLGKYPPNTGLLVVHDGDDVYQVRFSADLQQNASVVFRKKKTEK